MGSSVRNKSVLLIGVMALVIGLLPPGAGAQPPDCGPVIPTAEVTRGMIGQGRTVVEGTESQPFAVEVLGVLRGGVGVGRDMIIVEVSAPFIEEFGGIWQGMSGSPVTVGGELLGAVAFGLAFGSSAIGGLTPAEDMVDLIGLQSGGAAFAAAQAEPDEVVVTGELAAEIQRRISDTGASFAQGGVALRRLSVPWSVSGLSAGRLDVLQQAADAAGLGLTAHSGSSTAFAQVPTTAEVPEPGDNLAVAQSFGDLTAAAVGTATLVCDGHLVGFGHPFTAAGDTVAGAATADAITIVPDDTSSPYKLANIEALFGTIDQDRFAGVRATNGAIPDSIPVTSTVTDHDTGNTRDGRTDVLTPDIVADLAAFHLLGNVDTVIDRIGEGTAEVSVTVRGEGSDSGAFRLDRDNVFASPFDVGFESIVEMLGQIATMTQFDGEDVTIDSVDVEASYEREVRTTTIGAVRVGVDGAPPAPQGGGELFVSPGAVIDIEVDLTGGGETITVPLQVEVPEDAFGFGSLDVAGGAGQFFDECLFDPAACAPLDLAETAQELAEELAARPRNDEVVASLLLPTLPQDGGEPQPAPSPAPGEPGPLPTASPTADPAPVGASSGGTGSQRSADGPRYAQLGEPVTARAQVERVVVGGVFLPVSVDSGPCPGCPPVFNRFAGDDRIGTAAAIATGVHGFADTVVLAPSEDYPYALLAGPLANLEQAPVLLSADQTLSPATAEVITQLGATRAIIVATDGQLTGTVEADLAEAGITTVERLGGADRYAVAGAVAERIGGTRAWLVEGENADPARGWPDAMSAASVAGYEQVPILLTRAGDLPEGTQATIDALAIDSISIAGGEAAVGAGIAQQLAAAGIAVERIAGASRDETSYLLAQRAVELGASPQNTWMVTAGDFPDGLAAAPAVVTTGGVMIMGDGEDVSRTPGAVRHFTDLVATAPFVTFVGGFAAISPAVEQQVFELLTAPGGQPPPVEPGPAGTGAG